MDTQKKQKRILAGVVTSNKMQSTLVVSVNRLKKHPKYRKYYKVTKKYYVHYTEGKYEIGDKVSFIPDIPRSKLKRWKVNK